MLFITKHQGDADQNKNEISFHTTETGPHPKEQKQPVLAQMWGERDSPSLLLVQPFWKTIWTILKKLETELPFDPRIPLLGIYPGESKRYSRNDICIRMFIAAFFTIAKIWKKTECPKTDNWLKKLWYTQWNTMQLFEKMKS